ncbi:DUF2510 domain-containing protein [Pseudactinotalea sp. Z1748]|uniref:DUF2510 domain-containing protein n=1 Tax=Pseudactinotalea sp. Z1748 TaxID=3413027 RepID=UPI003C79B3CF
MSHHVPAGWYPDHHDASLLRYWDGAQWTQHTHPAAGDAQQDQAGRQAQDSQQTGQDQHTGQDQQAGYDQDAGDQSGVGGLAGTEGGHGSEDAGATESAEGAMSTEGPEGTKVLPPGADEAQTQQFDSPTEQFPAGHGQGSAPDYGHAATSGYGQPDQPTTPPYDPGAAAGYGAAGYGQGSAPGYGEPQGGYGQGSVPSYSQQSTPGYAAGGYGAAGYGHSTPGYGQPGDGSAPPPGGGPPGPGDQPKSKTGILIAIIAVVVVLLAGLIFLGVRLFGSDGADPEPTTVPTGEPTGEPTEEPIEEPTEEPTDEPTEEPDGGGADVDGGQFEIGDVVAGSIEVGQTWSGMMTVETEGVFVIDAIRGEQDPDLTLRVLDSSGNQVAYNDDRGGSLTSIIGGHNFDPYLALGLEAGDYTVEVGTWSDADGGQFELFAGEIAPLEPGQEMTADLDAHSYVARALVVEEAGEYTVNATAEEWEAAIALFTADGTSYTLEDPQESEASLTANLEPGSYAFVIADPGGEPDTFTFEVQGP